MVPQSGGFQGCLGILLLGLWFLTPVASAAADPEPPLTTIGEIQHPAPVNVGRVRTVEVRCVVTYYERKWDALFVQDDTGGSYVFPSGQPRPALKAGQLVLIRGRTHPNGPRAATGIREDSITIIGEAPLPTPQRFAFNELAAGRADGRWIEIEGVVRVVWAELERIELDVVVDGGRLRIHLPRPPGTPLPAELLHTRIRARGACGLNLGEHGSILGVRLFTPRLDLISVVEPSPDPVAGIPTKALSELSSLHAGLVSPGRVRVEGTVTCVVTNGPLFIQSGEGGLEVGLIETRVLPDAAGGTVPMYTRPDLRPGDRIQIVGYPATRLFRTVLEEAEVTSRGPGVLPNPIRVLPSDWLGLGPNARLVQIEGRVLHVLPTRAEVPPVQRFVVQTENTTIEAQLSVTNLPPLEPETRVRLTGVATADINELGGVNGWRIWLRDAGDFAFLARPWLNFGPAAQRLLVISGGIVVALLGWVLFLWRQLGLKQVKNAELEARIATRTMQLERSNASLRREVTERARAGVLQDALYRISEATHSVGDLPELYRQLHEIIGTLMPARNFYIALYDPTENCLTFPYYEDERSLTQEPRPWSNGLSEYVIQNKEPLLANATRLEELTARGDLCQIGPSAKVWLGVPLIVNGRATGVMAVQDYLNPQALTPEHQRILTYVAGQTATAIDRKRAEAALRESQKALQASQKRFRSAFANNPTIMTLARLRDGVLFEVNDAFVAFTGLTREEAIGQSTIDLGFWASASDRDALFQDLQRHGYVRGREVSIRLRDGRIGTVLLAAEVLELDGESSILAASLDVTERKEVEQQLRRALARERELGELKSNFVSLVSHEFRTPLEVILSSAEILERYHDRLTLEQKERQLAAIQKSVRRMADMMGEVLLLGRFEAGRVEFNPSLLDLKAFQQRIRDEITAATGVEGVRIELHADGDLSGACGDEGLLRHVFTNLLSNAVKYSPPGAVVRFLVRRDGFDAVFEVIDHGCGIPIADQPRLFQSFHRGANVGQRSGTGLGLVIVKRCVERHAGRLSFVSTEGVGTTFTVRLPLFHLGASTSQPPEAIPYSRLALHATASAP